MLKKDELTKSQIKRLSLEDRRIGKKYKLKDRSPGIEIMGEIIDVIPQLVNGTLRFQYKVKFDGEDKVFTTKKFWKD